MSRTADDIIDLVRKTRTEILVIDGFRGMRGFDRDPHSAREFLYQISGALNLQGVTTVISSEAEARDISVFPEATTADILIGIHYNLAGMRHQRLIEVVKARGLNPLSGLHVLDLTADGVAIYPRLEALIQLEERSSDPANLDHSPPEDTRLASGMPELDSLLGGGLPVRSSTLLLGSLGTGKTFFTTHLATTLALQGRRVLYLSFRETGAQLLSIAEPFDLMPRLRQALEPDGGLTVLRIPPIELNADIVINRVFATLDQTNASVLIIDSILELERAVARNGGADRIEDYLAALLEEMTRRGITSVFLKETRRIAAQSIDILADAIAALAENVVLLQRVTYGDRLHHVLSVLKMQRSMHDVTLREFTITAPHGIEVLSPPQSNRVVLDGIARQQGQPTETELKPEQEGLFPADSTMTERE